MATKLFEAGAPDVLYLVDVSGYVFRAYHAVAPLTSPTGEPTHAVFGAVNMLERLVKQCRPAMLAIAMDSGRQTFRKEIYPEYKATRPPPPEDLKQQMARTQEVVEAFAVPVFVQKGVEADDLIATAVRLAGDQKMRVVIVSADKDLMQLVSDDVLMWDTMRNKVVGPAEVEERFGIGPKLVKDLLALTGDTSDNIPGVPSVGPKTARDLLLEHGDVDGIYAALDSIKRKKVKEALENNREQAFLSRRLVALKDDCDVELIPSKLQYGGRDIEALRKIYAELGFQRHLAELEKEKLRFEENGAVSRAAPSKHITRTAEHESILDAKRLRALVDAVGRSGRLSIDLQTTVGGEMHSDVIGLGLSAEPGVGSYIPLGHRYVGAPKQLAFEQVKKMLAPILSDERIEKTGHHTKGIEVALERLGMPVRGVAFDSMLAAYLLDAEAPHRISDVVKAELGATLDSRETLTKRGRGRQLELDEVEVDEVKSVSAAAAEYGLHLWERLGTRLSEAGLGDLLTELELPLSSLLAQMETTGVLVDAKKLEKLGAKMKTELEALEKKAHDVVGRPFNVNSPRQLETILFDELGLKPLKRTKTSRSTDAATLEALSAEHELPALILEQRQIAKLKGTYVDALPALVNPDTGRIHTHWEQAMAATGRLASKDPNLQNIPIRTDRGREIRSAFIAPKGYELISADYSQIELRVLAHLSKDPVLVDAFQSGQDIHQRTAMEIFDKTHDEVTSDLRRRAKAVNFGVIYGQGDSGLAKSLGISRSEAGNFIAAYFRRYEGVSKFMDDTLSRARAGDSVGTLLGRRRILPDINSANRAKRFAAERIAMNTPIQGTAADLLKLAMLKVQEAIPKGARMTLTVHDELVFEVPSSEVKKAVGTIRESMQQVMELDVPLVVDVGHGKTWNEAH